MSLIKGVEIDREKTCSFTGHRIMSGNFDERTLIKIINEVISRGYDTFLVGMALGFDTVCFKALTKIKKNVYIRLIACVPCNSQSKFFNKNQRAEYDKMIESADAVINVSDNYFDGCMMVRNMFMVDNSSLVIAYLNYNRGGTYQTVKYAAENGREIIYVGK